MQRGWRGEIGPMRVAKLHKNAVIPTRKHKGDAGFDLHYCSETNHLITIPSLESRVLPTGITIEIPKDVSGLIFPKGGTPVLVLGGVIDNTYQGEILVNLFNTSKGSWIVHDGDLMAQIVFVNLAGGDSWDLEEVDKSDIHEVKTMRGSAGGINLLAEEDYTLSFIEKGEIIGDGTINVNEDGEIEYRGWD